MVSIERLVKIYNNFGDRENLSPLCSADEMLFDDNLTIKQNQKSEFHKFLDFLTLRADCARLRD